MDSGIYKPFRPSQIMRSEKPVGNVVQVLVEDYPSPFKVNVDTDNLVCLNSCVPVKEEDTQSLLFMPDRGKNVIKLSLGHVLTRKISLSMLQLNEMSQKVSRVAQRKEPTREKQC